VADVRLRINFFNELAAIEQEGMQAAVTEKTTALVETVGSSVAGLVESGDLMPEQSDAVLETFAQDTNQAQQEFLTAQPPSPESLAAGLESAFETLAVSLGEILSLAAPAGDLEPAEGAAAEPDVVADVAGDGFDFLTDLRAAFDTALANLLSALNEIDAVAELSPPNGNGAAYDKFLAMYNELRGVEPTDDDPGDTESLDTLA